MRHLLLLLFPALLAAQQSTPVFNGKLINALNANSQNLLGVNYTGFGAGTGGLGGGHLYPLYVGINGTNGSTPMSPGFPGSPGSSGSSGTPAQYSQYNCTIGTII